MGITLGLHHLIVGKRSNESLMLRFAESGNNALLDKLYKACGNDLYHFVLTLSEPTLAKDICQKTWLKVIEKKHLYRDSGQFKAWLFTLARNQLMDDYRLNKAYTDELDSLPDNTKNIEIIQQNKDIHQRFELALIALPFSQKEAFCLQQEGFSLEQIANMTHSTHETVKSRLRYAKDQLRHQLKAIG